MPDLEPAAEDRGIDSREAWIAVAVAFAATFTVFGIAYSYGAFLTDLRVDLGVSRSAAATLFSITSLIWFAFGSVTGAAADRFGPRRVLLVGAALLAGGLVGTAGADSIGVAIVSYGLGVGGAVACAYVPMVALVGAWFDRRRTLAVGIAVTGIGLGTLVVPPAAAVLIEAVGWRDAYRILAIAGTTVLVACALVSRPAPCALHPHRTRLGEAVRTADYRWLYLAGVLICCAIYVPFVHLPDYARERGVGPVAAAGLIGAIGAASVVGRLALGGFAERFGLMRTYQGCFAVMAASFVLWLVAGTHLSVMIAFAVTLGVGYGGFVALTPAVVAERFGAVGLGALLGVLYTGPGVGSAAGPPAAGAAIDAFGDRAAIAGALAVGVAAFCVVLRVSARQGRAPITSRPSRS